MNDSEENAPRVAEAPSGVHKLLNQHGYGFQYAVLQEARRLSGSNESDWVFDVAEFPVSVRGADTRVDFILRHRERPLYIVAECKRANPALSNWCFFKAPFVRRNRSDEAVFVEQLSWGPDQAMRSNVTALAYTSEAYHIGLEAKSSAPGEEVTRGRGAIDEAATQVVRGVNGLIENFGRSAVGAGASKFLIPVVFTTARLWVSNADLSKADLATGELRANQVSLIPKAWLAYQFPASEGLKHEVARRLPLDDDLGRILDAEYLRTVQIVHPSGIAALFRHLSHV